MSREVGSSRGSPGKENIWSDKAGGWGNTLEECSQGDSFAIKASPDFMRVAVPASSLRG